MKQCSKCGENKSYLYFYKHQTNKDGYMGKCKDCYKAHYRNNYSVNLETQRERSRTKAAKERLENPEKVKERNRKGMANAYENNPEKFTLRSANWKKENPEKVNSWCRKRVATKNNNKSFIISEKFLKRLYSSPCVACGSTSNISMDHIIPVSRGGTHGESNLQPLCSSCNSSKGNKLWIEWVHDK